MNVNRRTLACLVLLAAALSGCGGGDDPPAEHTVYYTVDNGTIGIGGRGAMTYQPNSNIGASSQVTAPLPWTSASWKARDGDFLYVSVQNQNATGTVRATIYVDSHIFQTVSSSGAFAIATASGTCC